MRILISILSDYLHPNFLLIKEFEGKYDQLEFVSTARMESDEKKKSHWLCKALGLEDAARKVIVVQEDDYVKITEALAARGFSKEDTYTINLTGGTKVMTAAVCDFFKHNGYDASFYYVPIGKNEVREFYGGFPSPLAYQMSLGEYMTINGLRFEAQNGLLKPADTTMRLFEEFKRRHFDPRGFKAIEDLGQYSTPEDRRYYGGEWFEEYCYLRLKKELGLPDAAICKNAKIYREASANNDNEIDVMFVKNNKLHLFECKVTMFGYGGKAAGTIETIQYKLAAIAKDFGLVVDSYLLTLHKLHTPRKFSEDSLRQIEKRARILGIRGVLDDTAFVQRKLPIR